MEKKKELSEMIQKIDKKFLKRFIEDNVVEELFDVNSKLDKEKFIEILSD